MSDSATAYRSAVEGRPLLTFRWVDAHPLMYNQEGKHQVLAVQGDLVRTRLIERPALDRYIREGKATPA
jgi:hypothetical protein